MLDEYLHIYKNNFKLKNICFYILNFKRQFQIKKYSLKRKLAHFIPRMNS